MACLPAVNQDLSYQHVAVIDDEPVVLQLLAQQLKCFGVAQCDLYTNGNKALEHIHQVQPDLVICDLKLPDIDGPQLIRALAELGYAGSLIVITGSDTRVLQTVKLLSEEVGLHLLGTFTKPVNPYELEWLMTHHSKPLNAEKQGASRRRGRQIVDEAMIEAGLSRQAIVPFYQAKWDNKAQRVSGFEVLSRWRDDDGSILGPGAFIPVIERSGQLTAFTMQLLDQVLKDSHQLLRISPDVSFAVNFGIESLQDRHLPDALLARLDAHHLKPHQLTIELTERGLADNAPNILEVMARLHLSGFQLSIDDFGTGYSSLSRAKGLPFTELKIDRAFVIDAGENASSRAVINSSIALARDLDMQIIAEGVESADSMSLMAEMGCDHAQGFHIARPQALEQVTDWLLAQQGGVTPDLQSRASV